MIRAQAGKMKKETVDRILAEIEERVEALEQRDPIDSRYMDGHKDGQIFGLIYVREMIKAHRKGEQKND